LIITLDAQLSYEITMQNILKTALICTPN